MQVLTEIVENVNAMILFKWSLLEVVTNTILYNAHV